MKYEKYLPLGSVVMLKGGTKRIMITGFCCLNNDKMFDYTGCLYPEGYISADRILLFNHDQIERIYVIGYSDDEEKQFKQTLKQLVEQYGVNNQDNANQNVQPMEQVTQPSNQEISQNNINETVNPNAINQNVTTEQVNMSNVVNQINETQN